MSRPKHLTTGLPRELRKELGIKDRYGEKKRNQSRQISRKERRKTERHEKRHSSRNINVKIDEEDFSDDDEEEDNDEEAGQEALDSENEHNTPKKPSKSRKTDEQSRTKNPKISKTVRHQFEQDDEEIEALEKKLGIKGRKKLPKAFEEEGLADLLGDISDDLEMGEDKKRKREEQDWLQRKRRKAEGLDSQEEDDSEVGSWDGFEDPSVDDEDSDLSEGLGSENYDLQSSENGDRDENIGRLLDKPSQKKHRENPYVPPTTSSASSTKYIPPSMRIAASDSVQEDAHLRRQVQGLLNKLSEANFISILTKVEELYQEHSRQQVTSIFVSLLLGLLTDRMPLQDTFFILHAGFISGLYKIIGIDFGAILIQNLVETFDKVFHEKESLAGKESLNLISLLSQLYNFNVVGSKLIFDYIRLFLQEITETNTELLLKIIRNSGPQLRQDDPSALKDIVLLIQPAVARIDQSSLSVRTKFMIETITDLKNNRMKTGLAASGVSTEHIIKMRKILGSLNSQNIRATEPIQVSRADIQNSEKKGKWWLVGASWKESDPLEAARQALSDPSAIPANSARQTSASQDEEPDLVSIAKAHGMNTDIRRSIFIAIMSATDHRDAHIRLLKLHLKKSQEYEIPRVLIHCAMEEETYNPYYQVISRRLCSEMGRRIKMSFMFTLWDVFKRIGENNNPEEDEDDQFHGLDRDDNFFDRTLSINSVVNLSKMYGNLVTDSSLDLGIIKNLNFAYLGPRTSMFVEILIITIIQQSQTSSGQQSKSTVHKKQIVNDEETKYKQARLLTSVFSKTRKIAPHIVKGLVYFIRKIVSKSDIVTKNKEKKHVKWGCSIAVSALNGVEERDD